MRFSLLTWRERMPEAVLASRMPATESRSDGRTNRPHLIRIQMELSDMTAVERLSRCWRAYVSLMMV